MERWGEGGGVGGVWGDGNACYIIPRRTAMYSMLPFNEP